MISDINSPVVGSHTAQLNRVSSAQPASVAAWVVLNALEAAMAFRESAQKGCVLKLAPGDRSKGVLGLVYEPRDEGRTRLSLAIPARFEGDGAVTRALR